MQINPYLNFNGNCEAAFKLYERCLRGKIEIMLKHAGTPACEHVPAEWQDKIMHARLLVGEEALMGSDVPPDRYRRPEGLYVSLQIKEQTEAERVFHELAESGQIHMPIQKTFWASRFGTLTDQFGTRWMINCE